MELFYYYHGKKARYLHCLCGLLFTQTLHRTRRRTASLPGSNQLVIKPFYRYKKQELLLNRPDFVAKFVNASFDAGVTAVVLFLSKIRGKSDQPFPLIYTYLFVNQFLFVLYNLAAGAYSEDVSKRAAPYAIKCCSDAAVHSAPGDAVVM